MSGLRLIIGGHHFTIGEVPKPTAGSYWYSLNIHPDGDTLKNPEYIGPFADEDEALAVVTSGKWRPGAQITFQYASYHDDLDDGDGNLMPVVIPLDHWIVDANGVPQKGATTTA